jgi:hypothetical protein
MATGSDREGRFDVTVNFCFLKNNPGDDVQFGHETQTLTLHIRHPHDTTNIILSPAIRFLAILLRRQMISKINTIDELLDTNGPMNITIKPEYLDKPVFLASVPGGRGLDTTGRPMTAMSLNDVFKRTTIAAGYPENTVFYAWRREIAAAVNCATSMDTVRTVLGHDPAGRTFERSYNNPTLDVDVLAIALGEKQTSIGESSHEVLHRVEYNITPEAEQAFLQAIVDQDPLCQNARTPAKKKNALKSARHRERMAMRQQFRDAYKETVTMDQFKQRVETLKKPGQLFAEIEARAKLLQNQARNNEANDDDGIDEVDTYQNIGERLHIRFDDNTDNPDVTTAQPTQGSATDNMSADISIDVPNFQVERWSVTRAPWAQGWQVDGVRAYLCERRK